MQRVKIVAESETIPRNYKKKLDKKEAGSVLLGKAKETEILLSWEEA